MKTVESPPTPFKGLMPFSEDDASFFFGRESDQDIIAANLSVSRLTLLYGESGVGKSSVLRAGVAPRMRKLSRQHTNGRGKPEFVVAIFNSWRFDPIFGIKSAVKDAVSHTFGPAGNDMILLSLSFVDYLRAWIDHCDIDIFVILDQFEEYFLYHSQEENRPGAFVYDFVQALNRSDLRANFLISIREDAYARLDFFKGHIPNLFGNYLRIDHLDLDSARAAIAKPIEEYNRRCEGREVAIDPSLIEEVLKQVATRRNANAGGGHDVVDDQISSSRAEGRILTPYLQLVMRRLWDEEAKSGSGVLRLETLKRLKGAENIVEAHLQQTMQSLAPAEQDEAAVVLQYLVTPAGTKIAYSPPDLHWFTKHPLAQILPVLRKLSEPAIRILRPVKPPQNQPGDTRYEIFHDVLGPAILKWREEHLRQREQANTELRLQEERRRAKRFRLMFAIALSMLLLGPVMLWLAYKADLFGLQREVIAFKARQQLGKLFDQTLNPTISDSTLLKGYQEMQVRFPGSPHIGYVEANIARLSESVSRFRGLAVMRTSDTLTITQRLKNWQAFASTQRASPEKDSANVTMRSLRELTSNFASIRQEENFVTCRDVINKDSVGTSISFVTGKVWVWASVAAPDSERVTINWYAGGKEFFTASLSVGRNPAGYRIFHSKHYLKSQIGINEVRLYNSQNDLIGRRVFEVKP